MKVKFLIKKSSTFYNHWNNIKVYSYIQPKRKRQSMRKKPPSHPLAPRALSNEATVTKQSKFFFEYWEKNK